MHRVPPGGERGAHAHRYTQQCLIAVAGAFTVDLSDGASTATYVLDDPNRALYLPVMTWAHLRNFLPGTVALALCDTVYNPPTSSVRGTTTAGWCRRCHPPHERGAADRERGPARIPGLGPVRRRPLLRRLRRPPLAERAAPGAAVPCRTDPVRGAAGMALRAGLGRPHARLGALLPGAGRPGPVRLPRPPPLRAANRQPARDRRPRHSGQALRWRPALSAPGQDGTGQHRPGSVVADGPGDAEQLHARARRQAPALPRLLPAARRQSRAGGSAPVRAGALLPAQAEPEHHRGDPRGRPAP